MRAQPWIVHREARMRRHHEELTGVSSVLPALALLIPFAGALWARIRTQPPRATPQKKEDL